MKREHLLKFFGEEAVDEACGHANALRVAETQEFNRKEPRWPVGGPGPRKTYNERALDLVVKHQLPFQSTFNSASETIQRFVKITCPYCGGETQYVNSGGSSNHFGIEFRCEQGHSVHLGGPWEMFSANPNKKELDE